ncbi:chemotaxis-specific protein-glutamate methyltransferase CheB [Methylobacterium brachiatum]|jgi:two-component system chemotaxis response regulator CheB|uniref:chemotaxis-specific protein-glutamate methyltransferase CheB n=1 Tax=Methylobacterium brachiatum TaxID=269660 RepID=UPI002448D378|nr:chemotaxis-specific protein-glutamate methyltransferase CheB [Methylobacterium brachiatum]MDH2308747.1 chemotaxis-specific protein-glutamate methyltransferase CheB [Methylobacterium brachiatum]
MIRALVADDSALMRRHLTQLLEAAGGFTVQTARNGVEVLEALKSFDPHVITLDVNMPEMDGITCLSRIMSEDPRPVVMVSSLTEEGAETTLQALSLGAVDFVQKPGGTISLSIDRIHRELLLKVRSAATTRVRRSTGLRGRLAAQRRRPAPPPPSAQVSFAGGRPGLVLVGVSTGGPGVLEDILPRLPADFPWPILVAQHMPSSFTGVFARRLNDLCAVSVVEVARQMPVEPGTVYIAKGDADLVVTRRGIGYSATPLPQSDTHIWHPSVARMVESALALLPANRLIAVQLTGMGDDGAEAMARLRAGGGLTIAQDEETSVVFGMPQELIKRGGASVVLPSDAIAEQLIGWLGAPEAGALAGGRRRGT